MKTKYAAGLLLTGILASWACAGSVRNIAVYTNNNYSTDSVTGIYENTILYRSAQKLSFLARVYYDRRDGWHNRIFYLGPVVNLGRYTYAEVVYGHGEDSDGGKSDHYAAEVTREMPGIMYGTGIRHGAVAGFSYDILSPFIKYWFSDGLSARCRLYLVRDSEKDYEYAFLAETEYLVLRNTLISAGATTGDRLVDAEYGSEGNRQFYSLFAGVRYSFNERAHLKYIFEFLSQENDINVGKNTFVLDIGF